MRQTEELEFEGLNPVWVSGSYPRIALELEKMLPVQTHVHNGEELPSNEAPPLIILCPHEEDVALEVQRLRASAPDVPILVLGSHLDEQLARKALLEGAHGFVHLEMQPAQIVSVLSEASKGKTVVSRDLLNVFLEKMASREDLIVLTPRQREFLELVATTATFKDEIMVPRQLLEAFLERDL